MNGDQAAYLQKENIRNSRINCELVAESLLKKRDYTELQQKSTRRRRASSVVMVRT